LKDPCLVWKIWDGLGFWIGIKGQNNSVAKEKKNAIWGGSLERGVGCGMENAIGFLF